jgi:glycosyltransferase involved in cell wall biosynthesis
MHRSGTGVLELNFQSLSGVGWAECPGSVDDSQLNVVREQHLVDVTRFPARSAIDGGNLDRPGLAPVLSVVLPNYNHAQYLARAIDAIARQSRAPDEIIVVDDASTDDSLKVLAGCRNSHPNIIVLVNDRNRGALASLQRGLEAARGRYIYFAAADDQVLPGFFEAAISSLEAVPATGLFCGETIVIDGVTGKTSGRRPVVRPLRISGGLSPQAVAQLLRRADNFIHTGSSVFRRQAVVDKGGFAAEAGSFSDGLLARKIALTQGMWFMPRPVANWVIHSGGLSRATALDREKAVAALTAMPGLIAADPDFPPWYAELFERRWRFGSARLALNATPPDKDLLAAMAPDTAADRTVIGALEPLVQFRIARLTILAWLTLRLRPFRLRDVFMTALARRIR